MAQSHKAPPELAELKLSVPGEEARAGPAPDRIGRRLSLPEMDVTETTFETAVVERSHGVPVVVDFWAAWCGPCLQLGPVLEREIEARAGQVALAKVDVDANQALARRFDVSGIPNVKAFRDGHVVAEFVGARSAAAVASFLDELLAPPRADALAEELRHEGAFPEVIAALEHDDVESALERIVAAVPAATQSERDRLRELAVALFERLGHEHPVTTGYRRRLASALY